MAAGHSSRERSLLVGVFCAVLCAAAVGCANLAGQLAEEVGGYPPEHQESYRLFVGRCSFCHSLNRALAKRPGASGWTPIVREMADEPGATIRDEEIPRIAAFLDYYTSQARAR